MKFRNALFVMFLLVSSLAQAQFSWFGGDTKKKHHEVLLANRAIQIATKRNTNRQINLPPYQWITQKIGGRVHDH